MDHDIKPEVMHTEDVEYDEDTKPQVQHVVQMKSSLDDLSTWQAIKRYKRICIICMLAAFSASLDGYQSELDDCASSDVVSNRPLMLFSRPVNLNGSIGKTIRVATNFRFFLRLTRCYPLQSATRASFR